MTVKRYPADKIAIPYILKDVRAFLIRIRNDSQSIMEYELLAEELLIKLIEAAEGDQTLTVCFKRRKTESNIVFSCCGAPILLGEDSADYGAKIILDYGERIGQTRKHGVNQITVSIGASSDRMVMSMAAALVLAILSGALLCFLMDTAELSYLNTQVLYPVMMLFVRLLQNLSIPIAFVSLTAYIVNFYASVRFDRQMQKIALNYFLTSLLATVLPFAVLSLAGVKLFGDTGGILDGELLRTGEATYMMGSSPSEILDGLLPGSLLEIFTLSNPLPMLLIAVLFGIGINSCSVEDNRLLRRGVNAVRDFLSRIIALIFSMLPFFFYVAIVSIIAEQFITHELSDTVRDMCFVSVLILLMFALQLGFYAVQLKLSGISVRAFWGKYKDMLRENFRIASNMDALPYNIRMLRRKLQNPQKESLIRAALDLGANVNMDGNCLIVTTMIMVLYLSVGYEMDFLFQAEMLLIILLLEIGSPNQPGSLIISMTVLSGFLGFSGQISLVAIIFEGFFFKLYSAMNAIGDLVTVVMAADDKLAKKQWFS